MEPLAGKRWPRYSISGGTGGEFPSAGLIEVNGAFYGTISGLGANTSSKGTVFVLKK